MAKFKIVTAFLAAILIFWLFYLGSKECSSLISLPVTSIEYDVSITNLKIVTAFLAAILISEALYLGLKTLAISKHLLTPKHLPKDT